MEILARVAKEKCQQLGQVPRGAVPTPAEPINADQRAKNDPRSSCDPRDGSIISAEISEIRVRRGVDCAPFSPPWFLMVAATEATYYVTEEPRFQRLGDPLSIFHSVSSKLHALGDNAIRRILKTVPGSFVTLL